MEATSLRQDSSARVRGLRAQVNEALKALGRDGGPPELYAPLRYVLAGEGKRLRPVLLLLTAEIFGTPADEALPAALAVEVFHNFTLVHDDVMDHAPERRGRPTVHTRWDVDTAILTGDLLLALAYEQLACVETAATDDLMRVFQPMVRRLCEGQALDATFETRAGVTVEDYLHMIDGKTGALLSATLELGGCIGGAGLAHREALRAAGCHLGRAYQIRDDLLDLTAEDARWGKPVGGDLVEGKKTFLLLQALGHAQGAERRWFARIAEEGGLPPGEVPEARRRLEALGVLDAARVAVERHSRAAEDHLEALPDTPARHTIDALVRTMERRMH